MSRTILGIYLSLKYHVMFISSSNVSERPGRYPAIRFPRQVGDPPHRSGHLSPRPKTFTVPTAPALAHKALQGQEWTGVWFSGS